MRIPPTARVLYLIGVAVGVFFLHDLRWVIAVLGFQFVLWGATRNPPGEIIRLFSRLFFFFSVIVLMFVFFPEEGGDGNWYSFTVPVTGWTLELSEAGLHDGLLMCLRIYIAIFTSMLVRRGLKSGEFVDGLRGIFLPNSLALALDTTLHLLEPEQAKKLEDGGGRGMGGGGGRGRNKKATVILKEIMKGDLSVLTDGMLRNLERARDYTRTHHPGLPAERSADLGVIAGMTLAMLTLKWLKVLPGLPFAPGHKTVLLLPMYLLAAELTHTRWGATLVGASMGIISFLMGDGRYGIFEVFKHIAPGIIIDLLLPLTRVMARKVNGALAYGMLGFLAAFGRFTTIVVIAVAIGAPDAFYAIAAPLALVHLGFGAASGVVSFGVMKSLRRFKVTAGLEPAGPDDEVSEPAAVEPPAPSEPPASGGGGGMGRGSGGGRGMGGGGGRGPGGGGGGGGQGRRAG